MRNVFILSYRKLLKLLQCVRTPHEPRLCDNQSSGENNNEVAPLVAPTLETAV